MAWTLEKICSEVRLITGVYADDIPDERIFAMIQDYWTITFPSLIKTESLQSNYHFLTRVGESSYPFPTHFVSLNPLAVAEGFSINLSYNSSVLDLLNYQWVTELVSTGDDSTISYSFTLSYYAEPSSLCAFTNNETLFLNNSNFIYLPQSKSISITLANSLDTTDSLRVKYKTTNLGRPSLILVKDQKLTVYPFPDREYFISISGILRPKPLCCNEEITNIPPEFFDLIVYGSALKLFALTDRDAYMKLYPIYKRQESIAMSKTHHQLMYSEVNGL